MLQSDRIGKPESPALDRSGKCKPWIPVAQARAALNVDSRHWIRRAEAPLIVAVRRLQIQNARTRVRVARANPPGLHLRRARPVPLEALAQRVVHRIADLESIQQILCFARTRSLD